MPLECFAAVDIDPESSASPSRQRRQSSGLPVKLETEDAILSPVPVLFPLPVRERARERGVCIGRGWQARAILAARLIAVLDKRSLTVRKAATLTGFAAADFSRVRNADLGRFTLARLIKRKAD